MIKPMLFALIGGAFGAAQSAPVSYAIDPTHTVVTFEISHWATSTQRGRIQASDGLVTLDRAASTGRVDVTLDMRTLSVAVSAFEATLRGDRAFKVESFPTARFVGEQLTFAGDKVTSVSGQLSIAGISRPATLHATHFNCYENALLKREVCGGDFETTIQRSQFGLGMAPATAPDNVRLLIQVEGIRQ